RKTVEENGKKTAIVDYTYKSQLRKLLPDNTYNAQLDKLQVERKKIKQFAREVNGSPDIFSAGLPLKKRHQFEVRAGFTFTKAVLTYIPYQQDSLRKRESFMQQADIEYLADEKQQLGYITAGFLYKWKIGRKYSYLKTGLLLNQALKTKKTHKPVMHTRYKSLGNGYAVLDTVGYSFDYYTYNLSNTEIPVSYYAELTDGRLRPFLELGLTTKIYHQASVSLKREIHDETRLLRTETGKMKLPGFSVNPLLG